MTEIVDIASLSDIRVKGVIARACSTSSVCLPIGDGAWVDSPSWAHGMFVWANGGFDD